ncbi:ABC transporter [Streptomyces sp. NPDC052077]|uniref:ABC transporter n=1 Tax=Streptomyces sp. NPDC052077 TaxID=3154757 RepID=UPI00343454D0
MTVPLVAALVRPVWRTLPWRSLGAAGGVGLLLAGLSRVAGGGVSPWLALVLLRAAVLAGAVGLALLLDDPARHPTTPVPVPRPLRQALRAVLVAPLAALWWAVVLCTVPAGIRPPVAGITTEAVATGVLAVAGAVVAVRLTPEPRPGPGVAVGLLLTAVLAALLLPHGWSLFPSPDDPSWSAAHDRWTLVTIGAAAAWAVCTGEPLARGTERDRGGRDTPG